MGRMNTGRILLGGLLAGVIINASEFVLYGLIMADQYDTNMQAYGLTEPAWAMIGYVIGAFVLGIVITWTYAAIRPRFGPGMRTAIIAGAVIWVAAGLIPFVWTSAMGLGFPAGATAIALVWGLVEYCVGAMAGGWLYREDGSAAAAATSAPPMDMPPV